MIRRIVKIDAEKCNGCALCVDACHEGAIGLQNGKAVLLRDDYCDGLGDCLPACPTGAISFEEREALAYDEAAVLANIAQKQEATPPQKGCPGSMNKKLERLVPSHAQAVHTNEGAPSQLQQWPVQIKLVAPNASYFTDAHLLIAADCTAYAYGNFHAEFMKGKVTIIGCPKLDEVNYAEKLQAILELNTIKSVTVVRMSVPCCGGIEQAVVQAVRGCGKNIPWEIVVVTPEGGIIRKM